MPSCSYLILVEEATALGQVMGANVFRVTKLGFYALNESGKASREDKRFIDMIQRIAQEKAFYFSYNFDLTTNLQIQLRKLKNRTASGLSE